MEADVLSNVHTELHKHAHAPKTTDRSRKTQQDVVENMHSFHCQKEDPQELEWLEFTLLF